MGVRYWRGDDLLTEPFFFRSLLGAAVLYWPLYFLLDVFFDVGGPTWSEMMSGT